VSARVHLRQIQCFLEVARNGSIKRTADALNVSQPGVTKTIKELEAALGAELFTRVPTGVTLTPFGEALLRHATPAIAELNAGFSEIEALKNSADGGIRVGGLQLAMSRLLPIAVARLKRHRPHLNVSVIPGTYEQLLPALRVGELDMIFGRRGDASEMSGLVFEVFFQDRLVIAALPGHPLTLKNSVELEDMIDYPWIVPLPKTAVRECLNRILLKHKVPFPRNCFETTFGSSTWSYMRETGAIAALPSNTIYDEIEQGDVSILKTEKSWTISDVGIARRPDALVSQSARLLIKELRQASKTAKLESMPQAGTRKPRGALA
jgi:LysR family pca operon transcriptional activator